MLVCNQPQQLFFSYVHITYFSLSLLVESKTSQGTRTGLDRSLSSVDRRRRNNNNYVDPLSTLDSCFIHQIGILWTSPDPPLRPSPFLPDHVTFHDLVLSLCTSTACYPASHTPSKKEEKRETRKKFSLPPFFWVFCIVFSLFLIVVVAVVATFFSIKIQKFSSPPCGSFWTQRTTRRFPSCWMFPP